MKSIVMALAFASAVLPSAALAADELPKFDVRPSCRGASAQMDAAMDACLADEEQARAQLAADWAKYPARDKTSCVSEGRNVSGLSSYVELLTCLQIARDARELEAKEPKQK